MGTRHLTIVRSKGKVKVAQYGQWDGYPTGQGDTIQKFIQRIDTPFKLNKFKKLVDKLGKYTARDIHKIWKEYGADDSGYVSTEIANKVKMHFPELSRDTGAEILNCIYNGEVKNVALNEEFEKDTLFCEYCYKIDLDDQTVTMNGKKYSFEKWRTINLKRLK